MVRTQKCCGCLSGANLTTSGDCPDRTFKAVTGPRQNRINHGHGRHSNKSEKSVSQTPPKCPRRRLCEKVTRRSQEGHEDFQKLPERSREGHRKVTRASKSFQRGHEKVTRRSRRPPRASKEVTKKSQEGHEDFQKASKEVTSWRYSG